MAAKYNVERYTSAHNNPRTYMVRANMIQLVREDYVVTEWMQDAVLALRVGDSQLSDKDDYFITRVE